MRSNFIIKKISVSENTYTGTSAKKNYEIYTVILTCEDGSEVAASVYTDDKVTDVINKCIEMDGEDVECVASIEIKAREHQGRYFNDVTLRKIQTPADAEADAARRENIRARLAAKKAQKAAASKPAAPAGFASLGVNQPKRIINPFTGKEETHFTQNGSSSTAAENYDEIG